jgi:hypothetical protein
MGSIGALGVEASLQIEFLEKSEKQYVPIVLYLHFIPVRKSVGSSDALASIFWSVLHECSARMFTIVSSSR